MVSYWMTYTQLKSGGGGEALLFFKILDTDFMDLQSSKFRFCPPLPNEFWKVFKNIS